MENIYTYLEKHGQISLEDKKLNEVDILILEYLSYFSTEKVMDEKRTYHFHEVISRENKDKLIKKNPFTYYDEKLLDSLIISSRYNDLEFTSYSLYESFDEVCQFFAANLHLKGKFNLILFRGTNGTLYGMVEDLLFILEKQMKSVTLAVDYIKSVEEENSDNIILAGHSKGGTIAELSLGKMEDSSRIKEVYNFDGPGYIIPPKKDERVHKFISRHSIFGLLLHSENPYKVIDGKNYHIINHMIYSWFTKDDHILLLKKASYKSLARGKRLDKYIESHSQKEIDAAISYLIGIMKDSRIARAEDISPKSLSKFNKSALDKLTNKKTSRTLASFLILMKDLLR